jgi:hypothetical protein
VAITLINPDFLLVRSNFWQLHSRGLSQLDMILRYSSFG